ncbi:MAG: DUF3352 domain-containing protein [Chloroflexi bacterium]|nr:DUF3352 domain-containing protein [Chloroflexota bacterium]
MSLGWSSIAFADDSPTVVNLESQHLQATVLSNQVNLRSGPGQNYAVVARVHQGLRLPILAMAGDVNGWYEVEPTSGQKAWVASWVVNVAAEEQSDMLAPSKSTLYISVDTSPGFFDRMSDLYTVMNGGSGLGLQFQGDIERMLSLLFNNPLITAQEVRPWLGSDVSIVNLQCLSVTMSDFLMSSALDETPRPSVVIMASIIDPVGAQAFIDHTLTTGTMENAPKRSMTYNGFNYTLLNDPTAATFNPDLPPLAIGIVGDHMVLTQGQTSYEAIIDVANGSPSLGGSQNFQDVYGGLVPNSFAKVYVSPGLYCPLHESILYPALKNDLFANGQLAIPSVDPNGTPEQIQQQLIQLLDNTFKGYGVGFRDTGSGLTVDLVSGVNEQQLEQITGLPADQLKQIVDDAGLNLFGFLTPQTFEALTWGTLTSNFSTLRDVSANTPQTTFSQQTGLTSDVLNYIDGSITMGYLDYPVFNDTTTTGTPSYFLMVVESSDTSKAATATQALIDAALKQPGATTTTRDFNGVTITRVVVPAGAAKIQPSSSAKSAPDAQSNGDKVIEFANIGTFTLLTTGGNIELVITHGSQTSSGQFTPDWRLLAGLPVNTPTNGNASDAPFVAYMDIAGSLVGGQSSHIKASAIVTPALNGENSSRITIICKICRHSDTC